MTLGSRNAEGALPVTNASERRMLMLVLDRPCQTAVNIGPHIRVRVLRTGKNRAVLGIEAPRQVPIWRDEIPPREMTESQGNGRARKPMRILVVEDDPDHAELIRLALAESGLLDVALAKSGADALAVLENGHDELQEAPALVLLDLNLPGVPGLNVLKSIKSSDELSKTPVVVLSCSDDEGEVKRCLEAGANAFVSKSNNQREFNESILRIANFWTHVRRVA